MRAFPKMLASFELGFAPSSKLNLGAQPRLIWAGPRILLIPQ